MGWGLVAQATDLPWQHCSQLTQDREARLACFDRWAAQQGAGAAQTMPAHPASPAPPPPAVKVADILAESPRPPAERDCKNPRFSEMSRFWELEAGSDCGTFRIRGYRPISLASVGSDSVNTQPASPALGHSQTEALAYTTDELRIQLSVRTKIAQGLLTGGNTDRRDSLWFGYSQQSYWQLFNGDLSRPFRSTDHEPEFTYVYPLDTTLPGGWRLRYGGLSVVHQSNGQDLPLSRSWNRVVLMTGLENGTRYWLQARLWQRQQEAPEDDDNPGIEDLIGRAEVAGLWNLDGKNTLGLTLRHSLRAQANGSFKLEWLRTLADPGAAGGRNSLRLHTQLFSGFGDSLVDYNRRRTVFSVGLSLVDW